MTRLVLLARSPVARAGLQSIVSGQESIELVGAFADALAVSEEIERLRPDVILVEFEGNLKDDDLALLEETRAEAQLVILADTEVRLLGTSGALLPIRATASEIVAAVHGAAAGLLVLHPSFAQGLSGHGYPLPVRSELETVESLTPREVEILGMLAEGSANKQIARSLGISEHTVKFHVGSILAKLGAASRTEAVTVGVRQGLIMV